MQCTCTATCSQNRIYILILGVYSQVSSENSKYTIRHSEVRILAVKEEYVCT
jgi:hypothetical protein